MVDEIGKFNQARWNDLAAQRIRHSRPYLDLNPKSARELIDQYNLLGDLKNKNVLLLAGGGGQQSAAFGLLGANVTVIDLSETQLSRDHEVASHYKLDIETIQSDMRDISFLPDNHFDVVYHPYSVNFTPYPRPSIKGAARVIKPNGIYFYMCAHPLTAGSHEGTWNGEGYIFNKPYIDGGQVSGEPIEDNNTWTFESEDGTTISLPGPKEFRHILPTVINTIASEGFVILRLDEHIGDMTEPADPGTWYHFITIAPPWLFFWARYNPDATKIS